MLDTILNEGKKQALAILSFLPSEETRKEIVDKLMAIDPTPSKKYVEIFAKIIKSWMTDGKSTNIMYDRLDNYIVPDIIEAESKGFNKDISKISDYETLEQVLTKEVNRITRSSVKKGVGGLSPKDYAVVYDSDTVLGLMPFSWEASRVLASNYVGNCSGKWCIAYQKTDEYWNSIVESEGQAPVFIFNTSEDGSNYPEKFAFMFTEDDYEIWDQEDNKRHNPNTIIDSLGLTKEEVQDIGKKALKLAKEHIPNFGERSDTIVETAYSYEILPFKEGYNIFFSISNQEVSHGGDTLSVVFYKEGSAYAETGISFFSSEIGKKLLLSWAEEKDLSEFPDLINDTLVVRYQPNSYSSCLSMLSNFVNELGEEEINFDFHRIYNMRNFFSILFINAINEKELDFDLDEEPLVTILKRNFKQKGSDDFYPLDDLSFEWITYNTSYTMKDAIESIPNLKKFIYDETGWEKNDSIEARHGQKFLNY